MSSEQFDPDHQPSLLEAREWLLANRRDGVTCPCCHQYAKVYKRKLNSGVARCLIRLYREGGGDGYVYTPRLIDNSGTLSKGMYWGLLDMKERGWWMLTPKGHAFVRGWLHIPRFAYVYDGHLIGLDDSEMTDIRKALGDKFDYDELMRA